MARIHFMVLRIIIGLCFLVASAQARLLTKEEAEAIPNAFPVTMMTPSDPALRSLFLVMQRRGYLDETGKVVSMTLRLGSMRVPIVYQECGEADAFYSPKERRITLCYELIVELNQLLGKPRAQWYSVDSVTMSVVVFTEMHEIGHALLDRLAIPFAGSEEDSVDHFAVLMMATGDDAAFARRIIEAPAAWFHHHGDMYKHDPKDVHSADPTREVDALCLLYGQYRDPAVGRKLGSIAPRCAAHYAHVVAVWNERLAPYTRLESGRTF